MTKKYGLHKTGTKGEKNKIDTHKHMIHAIVPAFSKRHEFGVVIDSLVSAKLARIAVQHDLVTVLLLKPFNYQRH